MEPSRRGRALKDWVYKMAETALERAKGLDCNHQSVWSYKNTGPQDRYYDAF